MPGGMCLLLQVKRFITHLDHDLKEALLAIKDPALTVWQSLQVNLHDAIKSGGVDAEAVAVDGKGLSSVLETV